MKPKKYTVITVIEDGIEYEVTEYPNKTKFWSLNHKYHRINGPAIEWNDGTKEWYFNNQLHRINGPAIDDADGDKSWYIGILMEKATLKKIITGNYLKEA